MTPRTFLRRAQRLSSGAAKGSDWEWVGDSASWGFCRKARGHAVASSVAVPRCGWSACTWETCTEKAGSSSGSLRHASLTRVIVRTGCCGLPRGAFRSGMVPRMGLACLACESACLASTKSIWLLRWVPDPADTKVHEVGLLAGAVAAVLEGSWHPMHVVSA